MGGAPDHESEREAALQAAPGVLPSPLQLEPAPPPPPAQVKQQKQKASARSCVLTLINCAVGAPLLSLPYAYQQTGWAAGIMLTVFIAAMEAFTLFSLACHAEKTGSATYSALVRSMLGPAASILLSLVTITFAFGSCCAYLMILAECVQPMLEAALASSSSSGSMGGSEGIWWARRETIIVVLGSGVMLPLSFPDSLDALSGASSIALYGLMVIVGAVAFKTLPLLASPDYQWSGVAPLCSLSSGFLSSLPIVIYGFQSHTNVVAVFHELEDEPVLLPRLPSLGRPLASLAGSFASMASLKQLTTGSEEAGGGRGSSQALCSRSGGSLLPERWFTELAAQRARSGGGSQAAAAAAATVVAAAGAAAGSGHAASSSSAAAVKSRQPGDFSEASSSGCSWGDDEDDAELLPLAESELPEAWREEEEEERGQAAARTAAVRSAKMRGMIRIVYTAIGLTAAMYCLLGLFGYLGLSHREIGPNILDMYAFDDPTIQVARVMLALIQLVSYPINLLPARAAILHLLEAAAARRMQLWGFHTLSTLAFFGATLAVALSTSDLSMMFQLIGGTCGAVLIFGMPGGLLMGYAWQEHGPPHLRKQPGQGHPEAAAEAEAALLDPAAADPEMGAWPHQGQLSEQPGQGQQGQVQQLKIDASEEQGEQAAAGESLLPAQWGLAPGVLCSKLWWSGLALVLLTAALCIHSLHGVLARSSA